MASTHRPPKRIVERREGFQRYKRDVQKRGKPFYPFAMFHDTVMSLVVVSVIVVLAVIWKFTAGEHPDDSGWLGPLYKDKADPATTSFVPRPDWYFYFLFYLLRIFKWPESVILGTVGIPTIALVLLLALPFVDVRRERRLSRRPVAVVAAILTVLAMGVLTYKGAVASEPLAGEIAGAVPTWGKREGFSDNKAAVAGAKVFATAGCTTCHSYLGSGASGPGPDLTSIGKTSNRGVDGFDQYVADPAKFGNNVMPSFKNLGAENLHNLGEFLQASKGPK
jgi:ubiquinol-cytochrome c reductase cytochrome b subunit/menaquinol-cytochrome c reductase cytochrome b/c subunit